MKPKTIFIIIATAACGLALWSGALSVYLQRNERSGDALILKIEKNSKGGVAVQGYYERASEVIRKVSHGSFEIIGGPVIVERYREEPVLYGVLFIFFGAATCIAGFVVHLIRTDPRFN
jgi:hypothetical protein